MEKEKIIKRIKKIDKEINDIAELAIYCSSDYRKIYLEELKMYKKEKSLLLDKLDETLSLDKKEKY